MMIEIHARDPLSTGAGKVTKVNGKPEFRAGRPVSGGTYLVLTSSDHDVYASGTRSGNPPRTVERQADVVISGEEVGQLVAFVIDNGLVDLAEGDALRLAKLLLERVINARCATKGGD